MAAADCFSILPDDLLVRVIFFLPTRDAARTSVLSRRWRPLWPATDALNLDSSSYSHLGAYKLKDRMFSDAGAALRAAGRCPITKLSLFVKGPDDKYCEEVMSHSSRWSWDPVPSYDLLVNLLALQELRHIEELRLDFYSKKKEERPRGIYQLDPAVLPSNTLRVLDLACSSIELPRGDGDAFLLPRLSVLCLRSCSSQMKDLEDFIHAAPCLDSLHIECQNIRSYHNTSDDRLTLRCPTVTTLTLASITLEPSISIEVDAPCLHTLKYEGHFVDFSIKSPATELARVELAFTLKQSSRPFCMPEEPWFGPFWRSVRAFQNIKILKLKVPNIEGIAVGRDGQQTDHLVTFLSLQRLELEGPRDPRSTGDATVAVASLLHCCPMMNSLQIRIIKPKYHYYGRGRKPAPDFGVSLDLFEGRYSKESTAMIDAADGSSQVEDLPGLSGCEFDCLVYDHLKNVKLEFELNVKELNTFEVSLAKFFAQNCSVLLQIDDGKHNFVSHINWMVDRWRADALQKRKQMTRGSAN